MKKFKTYLSFLAVFTLLLSSCSKEDDENPIDDSAKASLSFGAYLNDMTENRSALRQAVENIPACSDDAPVYVEVILYQEGSPAVGTIGDPVRLSVNPDAVDRDEDGVVEYFTEESLKLEVDPGTYSLEYFTVLNAEEEIIWTAPYDDGNPESFAAFVEAPLPLEINLLPGAKEYVDVEILCFDDRLVNDYGYLFFDLETNEISEFCFFANLCLENGEHYPAHYSVDVWLGTDNTGRRIYSSKTNTVENEGENAAASPLCLALPNLSEFEDDEDYIYYEVTLLDWEGVYGDVEEDMIYGTLSRNDIEANFDGDDNVDYDHLRFGCDDADEDDDGGNDDSGDDGSGNDDSGGDGSGDDENDEGVDGNDDSDDDDSSDDENENDNDGDGDSGDDTDGETGNGDEDNDDNENGSDYGNVIQGCDGAFMFGDYALNENFEGIDANRWGWANLVEGNGTYTYDLWAGAGQNNTSAGTLVGEVTYVVDGDNVQVTIDLADGNNLAETHLYLDGDEPAVNGLGQYGNTDEGINENFIVYDLEVEDINEDGSFWIIVHTEVCGENS